MTGRLPTFKMRGIQMYKYICAGIIMLLVFSGTASASELEPVDNKSSDVEAVQVFNVTIPMELPVSIDEYGNYTYATDANIVNTGTMPCRITSVTANMRDPWHLSNPGATLSEVYGLAVDSTMVYAHISLGEANTIFDSSNVTQQTVIPQLDPGSSLSINYTICIPPQSRALRENIMSIVFTVNAVPIAEAIPENVPVTLPDDVPVGEPGILPTEPPIEEPSTEEPPIVEIPTIDVILPDESGTHEVPTDEYVTSEVVEATY